LKFLAPGLAVRASLRSAGFGRSILAEGNYAT
jgi:hypothetical protein